MSWKKRVKRKMKVAKREKLFQPQRPQRQLRDVFVATTQEGQALRSAVASAERLEAVTPEVHAEARRLFTKYKTHAVNVADNIYRHRPKYSKARVFYLKVVVHLAEYKERWLNSNR
jgi:hypothetical protein